MAEMTWFRFYNETLSDRKLEKIRDITGHKMSAIMGVWSIMLLMASESPKRGKLMLTEDYPVTPADVLKRADEDDPKIIDAFKSFGLITIDGGVISISNWDKRQFTSDNSTDRVRKHRENKQNGNVAAGAPGRFRNVSETPPESESYTESETESKDDDERGGGPPPAQNLTDFWPVYEAEIGAISPMISQRFGMYSEECPIQWLFDAVAIAAENNARKPAYVYACLDKAISAKKPPRLTFEAKKPAQEITPALAAYCTTANQPAPIPDIAEEITKTVGESPTDIAYFKKIIVEGMKLGWRPNGVSWMLDHYTRRELPTRPGGNTHATHKQTTGQIPALSDKGNRVTWVSDPRTGESYWYDTRTRKRVEVPA